MIECDVIRDLMPLYADGVASEASRKLVDAHTARCPSCRGQLKAMCTPMEPVPLEESEAYIKAVRAQNRRNIRRTLTGCAVVVFVCLIVWWAYMEINFSGEKIEYVFMEESDILAEEPRLVLSKEERLIGETLLGMEVIQTAMATGENQMIAFGEVEPELRKWLPKNVEFDDIGVFGTVVFYDYLTGNTRIYISYGDVDGDGIADGVTKTVATSVSPDSWEVDEWYELIYDGETGETEYRKYESRHMWFSFFDVP